EQYIKEGKGAVKWTRLSCRSFAANAVRLQLHALAYNLGNFMRTLAMPKTAHRAKGLCGYGRPMLRGRRTRRGLHAAVKGCAGDGGTGGIGREQLRKKDSTRCAGLAATHLLPHRQDFDKGLLSWAEVELSKLIGISNAVAVYRHRILRGWHIAIKSRVRLDDPGYPAVQPDIRC